MSHHIHAYGVVTSMVPTKSYEFTGPRAILISHTTVSPLKPQASFLDPGAPWARSPVGEKSRPQVSRAPVVATKSLAIGSKTYAIVQVRFQVVRIVPANISFAGVCRITVEILLFESL